MERMSPDVFLSRANATLPDGTVANGIAYDRFPFSAAAVVLAMQQLNTFREWNNETQSFDEIVYHTPGFTPVAQDAGTIGDPRHAKEQSRFENAYLAALHTGDLAKVHAAVDACNALAMKIGGPECVPQSEFNIVAHEPGFPIGWLARTIISQRAAGPDELPPHSIIPWWDTKEAFDALNAYEVPAVAGQ